MASAELKAAIEAAKRMEKTTGNGGMIPNAKKASLRDASDAQTKHPDLHLRWCKLNNTMTMANHSQKGYQRLPEIDGGREVDGQALFWVTKERHAQLVSDDKIKREGWLEARAQDFDRDAEKIAKYLRDKHGISVSDKQLTNV